MRTVRGSTRVTGVIGDPVRHSLSPAIHNAAFDAAGLDWVFVAFPVAGGAAADALGAMRVLDIAGLSVTMPHKDAAAAHCDDLSSTAARLRSVNTVVRRPDGSLFGESTDGEGLLRSLRDEGVVVEGRAALTVGAGGAARAIALALRDAGAAVSITARRPEAAEDAARMCDVQAVALGSVGTHVTDVDMIVNATPLGMRGEAPPFDTHALRPGQTVVDLVYSPAETPLLAAARAQGARPVGGLGMLVHQAALAFSLWTGEEAPLAAMRQAALANMP